MLQLLIFDALNELPNDEGGARFIVKDQAVGHAGAHHNILRSFVRMYPEGARLSEATTVALGANPVMVTLSYFSTTRLPFVFHGPDVISSVYFRKSPIIISSGNRVLPEFSRYGKKTAA